MRPRVSIVIPAFNQIEYCRQCVESIRAHTDLPYKLILVNNGSTDGVGAYFDSVPGATVVHAERNLGFPGGVNLGLPQVEGHVLLLNSDTIVPEGWLARLVDALESHDRIGMVGPMSNCVSGPQLIEGLVLNSLDDINACAHSLGERNAGKLTDIDRLVGFCLLIKDTAFEAVGALDESFGIGNFEDDDYCLRAKQAGYRLCMAEDCFVFHYGSRTFQAMGYSADRFNALIDENERVFKSKWGLSEAGGSHTRQVARRLAQDARALAENGDARGALRIYREAVSVCPIAEECYNDLGALLWSMGELERAYEQFERAVRLNPTYTEARENLCEAAKVLGRELTV